MKSEVKKRLAYAVHCESVRTGRTVIALSALMGLSKNAIYCDSDPNARTIAAVCRMAGVTADWILGLSEEGGPDGRMGH